MKIKKTDCSIIFVLDMIGFGSEIKNLSELESSRLRFGSGFWSDPDFEILILVRSDPD